MIKELVTKLMKNKLILVVIFSLGIILGLITYPIFFSSRNNTLAQSSSEVRSAGYKYINPLLDCEMFSTEGTNELIPLKTQLSGLVSQKSNAGLIQSASVYFRDLNNGPWFGINEEASFSPASLLKLPIMISALRLAETDPNYLNKKIKYDKDLPNVPQDYEAPLKSIEKDKEYSVDELITMMIENSDNQAMYLLLSALGQDYLSLVSKLFQELGLNESIDVIGDQPMSVKAYASLFRVLFNASYLNRSMSEKALDALTKVTYKNGLVAGVPTDVIVSHKFGQRALTSGSRQLHDCGIVYYPKHPYLLCVMTKGDSYDNLEFLIRTISQQVYQSVDEYYRKNL